MNCQSKVSVIIPCHNAFRYIDSCLNSIVGQTYSNLEIILCDDASTDGSLTKLLEWQEKDARIIVLQNAENLYAAASRNKCIDVSTGDYLLIQDVDDISEPNRVETLLYHIQRNEIDFVSSGMKLIREDSDTVYGQDVNKKRFPTRYDFLWNLPLFHPATMFTRTAVVSIGGYRIAPETRRGQDYDLFMRLYAAGYRGMNISDTLYLYRVGRENYKRRSFSARIGEMKIRYYGFKKMKILLIGMPFILKPLFAHVLRYFKLMLHKNEC